jgi:hypothetical protein
MKQACFALSIGVAILVADQVIDPFGPPHPTPTRDDIRAARKKFELEMKLDTKRPWDGMDLTGPHALEKPQNDTKPE